MQKTTILALVIGAAIGSTATAVVFTFTGNPTRNAAVPAAEAATVTSPTAAPAQTAKIVSKECPVLYGHHVFDITITNTGDQPIDSPHAFVNFRDAKGNQVSAADAVFTPYQIPPGSRASAHVIPKTEGGTVCELVGIQDTDGNPIELQ